MKLVGLFNKKSEQSQIQPQSNDDGDTRANQKNDLRVRTERKIVKSIFRRHLIAIKKGFFILLSAIVLGLIGLKYGVEPSVCYALMILGFFVFLYWLASWYFSVVVISNIDIEVVEQRGMFNRKVTNLAYENMANIGYDTKGLIQAILNYGSLTIQIQSGEFLNIDKVGYVAHKHKILTDSYNKRSV